MSPRRRKWQPIPIFLPGKFHGQRSLVEYGLQGCKRVGHDLSNKKQPVILDDCQGHYCGWKKPVSEVGVLLHDAIYDILKDQTMVIDQWLPQVKSGESVSLQRETGGLFERWWNCSVSCLWWWLRKCARVKIHRTIHQKNFYHMLIKTKQKPCGSQSQGGLRRSSAPCIYGLCSPLEQGWPVGPIKMVEATVNDFWS